MIKFKKLTFPKNNNYDSDFLILLEKMLNKIPYERITIKEIY